MPRNGPGLKNESHVEIIPVGDVDDLVVSVVAAHLQAVMGLNADVCPACGDPLYAYLPLRDQYAAGKIISMIESLPGRAEFKLGIVQVDLCTPILKFVFGESQLGGHVAVISICRLQHRSPNHLYSRVAKIGLHETGHLLGLGHCRSQNCLMAFASALEKLDTLPVRFCSACRYEIVRCLKHRFG